MNQVPAHILARQKRDLVVGAIGGLNAGSPPHISLGENRFTLVDDAGNKKLVPTHHIDICVIDANAAVSKIYFDPTKPYVPGGDNSAPPICWSDNGVGASAQASQPQNASCQLCPHNAWGSKVSQQGTQVKACTDVKKVAVVVPGIDMVFLLRIPPASLKNWGKYCQTLGGHGVDLPDAVTRLEFESQGVLKFTPMGYVDEATATFSDKIMEAKGTDQIIGRNDRPWGGQGEANKVAYAERAALPATAPVAPAPQAMAPPPQPFAREVGGVTPATPFGTAASTSPMTSPSDPFGGQPSTSSPTAATPEPAKRTRKKAEPAPVAEDGTPPFLQRNPPPAAPATPNPTQFGMVQQPAAPDAGVQAALDAAFRLPT